MSPSTRILVGPAIERLRDLPDESVHCCITSPPYWGMRTYEQQPGMIGLEPTFAEHLANLMEVFREVRRVLRSDGTLWVVYGDGYSHSGNGSRDPDLWPKQSRNDHRVEHSKRTSEFKPKDAMLMPHRLAIAMQDDGWWVRSPICWVKANGMPESVTDRPAQSYEMVYLFAKSERYFYDRVAVLQPPQSGPSDLKKMDEQLDRIGGKHLESTDEMQKASALTTIGRKRSVGSSAGVNLRNVWHIATEPFPGPHFAVMPKKLVELCILAATSDHGVCAKCGAPWRRKTRKRATGRRRRRAEAGLGQTQSRESHGLTAVEGEFQEGVEVQTVGWLPTCDHRAGIVPATALDPFAGAGTVGLVADRLARASVLIEISPTYAQMMRNRILDDNPVFAAVEVA